MSDPNAVLGFWFEDTPKEAWFKVDPEFDRLLRERFGDLYEDAKAGRLDSWADTAEGALALVVVLDQFSRNMFRGTSAAFARDAKARAIADLAVARGFDRTLSPPKRGFLYLPFEHSESLDDQKRCVALFGAAGDDADGLLWAVKHLRIIERFGRFPHRNRILGRESTPEEVEFLTQPDSSF